MVTGTEYFIQSSVSENISASIMRFDISPNNELEFHIYIPDNLRRIHCNKQETADFMWVLSRV
jgi:hypothetical protein